MFFSAIKSRNNPNAVQNSFNDVYDKRFLLFFKYMHVFLKSKNYVWTQTQRKCAHIVFAYPLKRRTYAVHEGCCAHGNECAGNECNAQAMPGKIKSIFRVKHRRRDRRCRRRGCQRRGWWRGGGDGSVTPSHAGALHRAPTIAAALHRYVHSCYAAACPSTLLLVNRLFGRPSTPTLRQ